MSNYNYETRKKLRTEHENILKQKINLLCGKEKLIALCIYENKSNDDTTKSITVTEIELMLQQKNLLPSKWVKDNYKQLIDTYISKKYQKGFYHIIDKLNQFQYSQGYYRRSVRTKKYTENINIIFSLIKSYSNLQFFKDDIVAYIKNDLNEELLDLKMDSHYSYLDSIIAGEIDCGNQDLIQSIKDTILSDNNTSIITTDIIRGIIKSSNHDLHKLLGDFLIAARLQEGIRQAICENMDCGTPEAFVTLFNIIYDNNFIRFSSIKRAVATWIGVLDESNLDRISKKLIELMKDCLDDKTKAYEYSRSNDSIKIIVALWCIGFYEVEDAITVMTEYVKSGTKNQILTMSYYNKTLYYNKFKNIVAKQIIENNSDDIEYVAAFINEYYENARNFAYSVCNTQRYYINSEDITEVTLKELKLEEYFSDRQEAYKHFDLLKKIYDNLAKKRLEFSPFIFPWYSVTLTRSQIIEKMCFIAYILKDNNIIEYVTDKLSDIDSSYYGCNRSRNLFVLLNKPKTKLQLEILIKNIANKESDTREIAYNMVSHIELTKENYLMIEEMLKYKTSDIRRNIIKLLMKQNDTDLIETIKRLISNKKEMLQTAGLDIILQIKNSNEKQEFLKKCIDLIQNMASPTTQEKILIEDICNTTNTSNINIEEGFGLYNPDNEIKVVHYSTDMDKFNNFFNVPECKIKTLFYKLDNLIEEHKNDSYITMHGDEKLLGNCICSGLYLLKNDKDTPYEQKIPFWNLWDNFYKNEIKDFKTLANMYMACCNNYTSLDKQAEYDKILQSIFGNAICSFDMSTYKYSNNCKKTTSALLGDIVKFLYFCYKDKDVFYELGYEAINYLNEKLPNDMISFEQKRYNYTSSVYMKDDTKIDILLSQIKLYKEEDFTKYFYSFYTLETNLHKDNSKETYYCYNNKTLTIFDYIKAYTKQIITMDNLYKAIFEIVGLGTSICDISSFIKRNLDMYEQNTSKKYTLYYNKEQDKDYYNIIADIYKILIDKMTDVECKRGDTKTVFSKNINNIKFIFGMDKLVNTLAIFGNEKLDRGTYYGYNSSTNKSSCLSHLIQVTYPSLDDNAQTLKEMLKNKNISTDRLIEVAMYAPQWIDIIGSYIGCKDFKSGCYYFMAHMNEYFDDKKKALISKYTPLTTDELNYGAFDIEWFKEVYTNLGEELFEKLYNGAKYISDGNKHTRCQKYSDAVRGKLSLEEIESKVVDKRNKDFLMSYGLVPIKNKKDILHRYEFIQQFLKESKKFGAQRRASESKAVEMALKNLTLSAGYASVTRLTLSMETELSKEVKKYFTYKTVDDIAVKLDIDCDGKISIHCMKNNKKLKNIPSRLKNNDYIIKIKELCKRSQEQRKRAIVMFEDAMEIKEEFIIKELLSLCCNDVLKPIITTLVLIDANNNLGFLTNEGLLDYKGNIVNDNKNAKVRIAHPYDIYKADQWTYYQKYFFEEYNQTRKKQPFKQVFRELYLKLEEESEKEYSMMFAGNQIQPQKTKACLRNRKWVADYYDGLQKVYFKENIIAVIYALADWFSPSDIEEPTLEYVTFYDRNTYNRLKIKDIPDIIYSEVMRDVDLAISIAHAGGVDPETSHSTIEMRKIIMEFNLDLFNIKNVTFDGNFAHIHGSMANYNIHLGTGIIHQEGTYVIHVLPVHSQNRGKLFLPFIDEDPKTAEIMSKIVLFARDEKIKDPYILNQIKH